MITCGSSCLKAMQCLQGHCQWRQQGIHGFKQAMGKIVCGYGGLGYVRSERPSAGVYSPHTAKVRCTCVRGGGGVMPCVVVQVLLEVWRHSSGGSGRGSGSGSGGGNTGSGRNDGSSSGSGNDQSSGGALSSGHTHTPPPHHHHHFPPPMFDCCLRLTCGRRVATLTSTQKTCTTK